MEKQKIFIIVGLVLMFVAYYTGVDWVSPESRGDRDGILFFMWMSNVFDSLIPLFIALASGILIQKGLTKK